MGKKVIYLIRHGKPEQGDEQRRFIGQVDLPLSAEGQRQAQILGEKLQSRKIDAVYCSDLIRSVETSRPIAALQHLESISLPQLREINLGKWDGVTFSEIARIYPKEFRQRGNDIVYFRPPEGESFADCNTRALAAFQEICRTGHENIVIVGHAGVNRLLLCHILGMPLNNLFRIAQSYACMNVIIANETSYQVNALNMII